MPKRTDIHKVLVIGSGPIIIGQACEFDYSGTQAIKALREEGVQVVLLNSNPATVMTDPEFADRTYIEPITVDVAEQIIERERPDALLPTMGGQTALNLAKALAEQGILEKYGVQLIGASLKAINKAEDRQLFKAAMQKMGIPLPRSGYARSLDEAVAIVKDIGFPAIIRPSFTLGGTGGGVAFNSEEFEAICPQGLKASPTSRRCWSRRASSAGRSTSWRWSATRRTTSSSSAPSRTSTRWVSTPATASPWPPRRR